jgi:glycosyltransferase involved in cell wall biosynthesis
MALKEEVTIIIKTFIRRWLAERAIASIRAMYKNVPIILVDDSPEKYPEQRKKEFLDRHRVKYLTLPFDCGLSWGRNVALAQVTTPYFCLIDDDHVFYPTGTKLEFMVDIVKHNPIDLLGGVFYERAENGGRRIRRWDGMLKRVETILGMFPTPGNCDPWSPCDITHNFFVADTAAVREKVPGGWDPDLKVQEHIDFFIRGLRYGLKCGHSNRVAVIHDHAKYQPYEEFRFNRVKFMNDLFLQKHGLSHFVNFQGVVWKNPKMWPGNELQTSPDWLHPAEGEKCWVDFNTSGEAG